MHPELTTLFFQTELLIPSLKEFRIGKDAIRALYVKLSQPGHGTPYENLELQGEEPRLYTRRDEGASVCQFSQKAIRIEEHSPEFDVDEFVGRVKSVLRAMEGDFPPFVFLQRCRIQCIVKTTYLNSVELLAGRMANVYSTFMPLGRSPSFFGVRFRFLPMYMLVPGSDEGEDEEGDEERDGGRGIEAGHSLENAANATEPSRMGEETDPEGSESIEDEEAEDSHDLLESDNAMMTLRFETYSKDVSYVWMEATAEFHAFNRRGVFMKKDIDQLGSNISGTHNFLRTRCVDFLDRFDKPQDQQGDE